MITDNSTKIRRFRAGQPAELPVSPLPIDVVSAEDEDYAQYWKAEALLFALCGAGVFAIIMGLIWGAEIFWSLP